MESQIGDLLSKQYPADGPGCVALVAKEGKVIYREAIGMANLELDVSLKPEHVFRIGSITKQFTACAILKLVEEGRLSLQDDITDYIEDFPTHGHTITIEHLLTHTSGIRSYTSMEKFTPDIMKKDLTPKELIDFFKNEPMDFAPGERYLYNNSAYFMLGYIIEVVSGQTYEEYIEDNFFGPLGMGNSYYGNTSRIIKNRAAGYQKSGDEYGNADFLSMTLPYAAGSLLSTVDDLYTWYRAVMNYEVVSKESLEKAHTRYRLNNGDEVDYGYGWSLQYIQESPTIEHGGGINGYLTSSIYHPEELKAYEGVYLSENEDRRIITFKDGQLYSRRNEGRNYPIVPFAEDLFFFEGGIELPSFERNQEGEITAVVRAGRSSPETWNRTDQPVPHDEE